MNNKKIIAIVIIYIVGFTGWFILGTATSIRSGEAIERLGKSVEILWGKPLVQNAPSFSVRIPGSDQVRWITPSQNKINVEIIPDYKKKGLNWYSTYNCLFEGNYLVTNDEDVVQKIRLHFDFPEKGATYDNFQMLINEKNYESIINTQDGINEIFELDPGQNILFKIGYKTRGMNTWSYQPDKNAGIVKNLILNAKTGFCNIDYTEGSLSPMSAKKNGDTMNLKWEANYLITNQDIGIIIPDRLNPGPLTTRITFFAPVCLIFFFVLIVAINIMYRINMHPMHFLFVTGGFFAFHLLLVYLSGHIGIHISFFISTIVSVSLVTAYLYAALGRDFPWKLAVAGQLFFLVLFSYSFFIKGFTGLTVAIGSVVTLATLMKITAHVNWDELFTNNFSKNNNGNDAAVSEPPPLNV